MNAPPNWPSNVRYISNYRWDERVPLDERKKYSLPSPPKRTPPSALATIQRISDKSHPAHGQFGLVANKTIAPQAHICDYFGFITTDANSSRDSQYLLRYALGLICDGEKMGNEGRMCNDYHGIAEGPNVRFKTYTTSLGERRVGIFALDQQINKGQELLIDYGRTYHLA